MQTSPRLKPTYTTITKRSMYGDLYQSSKFTVAGTDIHGTLFESLESIFTWTYEIWIGKASRSHAAVDGDRHEAERMIEFRINEPDFR